MMNSEKENKNSLINDSQVAAFLIKEHGESAHFILNWFKNCPHQNEMSPSLLGMMIVLHKNNIKPTEMKEVLILPEKIIEDLNTYYHTHTLPNQIKEVRKKINENPNKMTSINKVKIK